MSVLIDRLNLATVVFCGGDETRGPLQGLYVSKQATVAGNGYLMMKVDNPKQEAQESPSDPSSVIIPAEACSKAIRLIPAVGEEKHLPVLVTALNERHVELSISDPLSDMDTVIKIGVISEGYPEVESIFPTSPPQGMIHIDARLLRKLVDFFARHCDPPSLTIELRDSDHPVVIRGKTNDDRAVVALLMPLRGP